MFRNVRLVSMVGLVVLLGSACSWVAVGHDAGHSFFSRSDTKLNAANVGGLHELWKGTGTQSSAPVAANGRVFTVQDGNAGSELASYVAAGCAAVQCGPVWMQPAGGNPVVIGANVVAMASVVVPPPTCFFNCITYRGGTFDSASGALATGSGGGETGGQYPVVADGGLYHWSVAVKYFTPPRPTYLYQLNEPAVDGVTPTPRIGGYLAPQPFSVVDGSIYLVVDGRIDAYLKRTQAGCALNVGCFPTWSAPLAHGGAWDGLVTVANGSVFASEINGDVEVFNAAGCGATTCPAVWTAAGGTVHVGQLAVTDTTLFVPSDDGHLYAFAAAGCGAARCAPIWTADLGSGVHAPAVAGDIVFVTTDGGRLVALDARGCAASTCSALASVDVGSPVRKPLAISAGRVFASDESGTLHAFGLS